MACTISAADFQDYFDRGQFEYGASLPSIRDKDITNAISEAGDVFNESIYPDEEACKRALLYLTAHFLLNDTEAADTGGGVALVQSSRSADGISEANVIPEWMTRGDFAFYATTYYGQKYLALSVPYLGGAVSSVAGATQP